jgi:NDP-hexose 2,3-enoyl reductase
MNFGPQTSQPDSFVILEAALANRINLVDTANAYAW